MYHFDDIEDANKKLKHLLKERVKCFCPVINNNCNLKCVCLIKPEVLNLFDALPIDQHKFNKNYIVTDCDCCNSMVFSKINQISDHKCSDYFQ